jgi:hypothetical protein
LNGEIERDHDERDPSDAQREMFSALGSFEWPDRSARKRQMRIAEAEESTIAFNPNPIRARLPVATAVATAALPTIVFHATVSAQRRIARRSAWTRPRLSPADVSTCVIFRHALADRSRRAQA